MSDASQASESARPRNTVIDPVSKQRINIMGLWFLIVACLLFYLLITTWPVLEAGNTSFSPINLFGFSFSWAPDRQMLFTVMMAGAIGSLTHTLKSFGDYVGNRELSENWIWFLVLRIPIGIALAVLFYCIIRGGLLLPTLPVKPPSDPQLDTLHLNPYGMAAFAALAGMFSKQATDKLAAIFDAVFAMKNPVDRDNPLGSSQSLTVVPTTLNQGKRQDLTVTGRGFQKETTATVNGNNRPFVMTSPTEGKVAITDEDVRNPGVLTVVVTNPNNETFKAAVSVVATEAPGSKPVISATEPKELTAASPKPLTVIGRDFENGCTATINAEARLVTPGDDKKITVTLADKDLAPPAALKLVVKNPGAQGQSSEAFEILVK